MNTDVIGTTQRFLKVDVLNVSLLLLDSAGVTQLHQFLNSSNVLIVMIRRVVAQDVHVETGALLDHCQSNSPGANNRDRLASHRIAEERKKLVPRWPFLLSHQAL